MKRLFVAVTISEEVKERIKSALSELSQTGADLKLVSLSHLHFTLKFLGDVDEKKIPELEKKLQVIAEKTKKFDVSLEGVSVFPSLERISVVWIGTEGSELVSPMKEISKELDFIRKNDHPEEIAHLTIARVKTGRNKEKLREFVKKYQNKEFGKMTVDRMILFESELKREGVEYRVVKEFGLRKG